MSTGRSSSPRSKDKLTTLTNHLVKYNEKLRTGVAEFKSVKRDSKTGAIGFSGTRKLTGAKATWKTQPGFVFMPALGVAGERTTLESFLRQLGLTLSQPFDTFLIEKNDFDEGTGEYLNRSIFCGGTLDTQRKTFEANRECDISAYVQNVRTDRKPAKRVAGDAETLRVEAEEILARFKGCVKVKTKAKGKTKRATSDSPGKRTLGLANLIEENPSAHFNVNNLSASGMGAKRDGKTLPPGSKSHRFYLPGLGNVYVPVNSLVKEKRVQEDRLAKALEGARNAYTSTGRTVPAGLERDLRARADELARTRSERKSPSRSKSATKVATPTRVTTTTPPHRPPSPKPSPDRSATRRSASPSSGRSATRRSPTPERRPPSPTPAGSPARTETQGRPGGNRMLRRKV